MRYLYVIGCGLVARAACGQTIELPVPAAVDSASYQVATDSRRVSSLVDSTGTCTELLSLDEPRGLVRVFYPSGRLREYVPYADLALGIRYGVATTWYESGQLRAQQIYLAGRRDGPLLVYYESGQLRRHTQYKADNELPGSCYGPQGEAVPYFPYEQPPLYPGGHTQLTKEITKALRIPRRLPPVVGFEPRLVDIVFQVAEDGRIEAPQVAVSSQVPALDQAVLASVIKLAKRFIPGKRDGLTVRCSYHLPVQLSVRGALNSAWNQRL